MTVKVVKMYTPRKVGKSSVALCEVKDTFGKGAKISVWNELINKVKADKILLFENQCFMTVGLGSAMEKWV